MGSSEKFSATGAGLETESLAPLRLHPNLYEISTLPWLLRRGRNLGRRVGLADVPLSEWERLKALGFDLIYLMGVWKRSPLGRTIARSHSPLFAAYDECLPGWRLDDVLGSPFSIQAYEPDPLIGTWDDLADVHRRFHDIGLRLILDVIPNHTGPDHRWIREHPEYYVRGDLAAYRAQPQDYFIAENAAGGGEIIAHGRDPNFPPWSDTAQLNYFNPELRAAMLVQLREISEVCDGARCDMAMLLLNDAFHQTWEPLLGQTSAPREEFWQQATRALPNFIWIAEAYNDSEWALQQLGFTFTYDKRLYDRLRDGFTRDVYLHLKAEWDFQVRSVRFLENHDEPRAASVFGETRMPAVAVLAATVPGMHFFNDGQLDGVTTKLIVQLARAREETVNSAMRQAYERILNIANASEFHAASWKLLEAQEAGDRTNSDLIAYLWNGERGCKLVVVNLGNGPARGKIFLPDELLVEKSIRFHELLNDSSFAASSTDLKRDGFVVKLDAFGAQIFECALPASS